MTYYYQTANQRFRLRIGKIARVIGTMIFLIGYVLMIALSFQSLLNFLIPIS